MSHTTAKHGRFLFSGKGFLGFKSLFVHISCFLMYCMLRWQRNISNQGAKIQLFLLDRVYFVTLQFKSIYRLLHYRHETEEYTDSLLRLGLRKVRCLSRHQEQRPGSPRENRKNMVRTEQRPHSARAHQLRRLPRKWGKDHLLRQHVSHPPMRYET